GLKITEYRNGAPRMEVGGLLRLADQPASVMAARGQQPQQPQRDLAVSANDEDVHAPTVPAEPGTSLPATVALGHAATRAPADDRPLASVDELASGVGRRAVRCHALRARCFCCCGTCCRGRIWP